MLTSFQMAALISLACIGLACYASKTNRGTLVAFGLVLVLLLLVIGSAFVPALLAFVHR